MMKTATKTFDLLSYPFPKLTDSDIVFSRLNTDPILLEAAKEGGFDNRNSPCNELAEGLFCNGGRLDLKKDLPEPFKTDATKYLKALMASWNPKHEDKMAVCALILSGLINPKKSKRR